MGIWGGGTCLVIGVGIFFWVLRDYSRLYYNSLTIIFDRIESLKQERSRKWEHHDELCNKCLLRAIGKIKD